MDRFVTSLIDDHVVSHIGKHLKVEETLRLSLKSRICSCFCREALLAEMGVALREDGGTVGVFSPKKVRFFLYGGLTPV